MKLSVFLLGTNRTTQIYRVGQQVIALTEDRNSGESQNILQEWVNRITIIIYVKTMAKLKLLCQANRNIKIIYVKKIAIFLAGKLQYCKLGCFSISPLGATECQNGSI